MAFRDEKDQDPTEEVFPVDQPAGKAATSNGRGEKRRGRTARQRRQEAAQAPATEIAALEEVGARKKDAPTPGRRQKERSANIIVRAIRPVRLYLEETMAELRKVTWPAREEAMRLSLLVLGTTLVSAMVLGLYNYVLDIGLDLLLRLVS